MGVLFICNTENANDRIDSAHSLLQLAQRPIASIATAAQPGGDYARLRTSHARQTLDGRKVAFKVATRDAKAGSKIGIRTDASIKLESGSDLGPVGANPLA